MKTANQRPLRTQFGADVQFDLEPMSDAEARRRIRHRFAQLQAQLVEQRLYSADDMLRRELEEVANEAAAMAWTTPYPILVLPVLFDEKARTRRSMVQRQKRIRQASRGLVDEALA